MKRNDERMDNKVRTRHCGGTAVTELGAGYAG